MYAEKGGEHYHYYENDWIFITCGDCRRNVVVR